MLTPTMTIAVPCVSLSGNGEQRGLLIPVDVGDARVPYFMLTTTTPTFYFAPIRVGDSSLFLWQPRQILHCNLTGATLRKIKN
jgi:hypothetical protein